MSGVGTPATSLQDGGGGGQRLDDAVEISTIALDGEEVNAQAGLVGRRRLVEAVQDEEFTSEPAGVLGRHSELFFVELGLHRHIGLLIDTRRVQRNFVLVKSSLNTEPLNTAMKMRNLMENVELIAEGLIRVPPRMEEHIDFLLRYHVLWWARDQFKTKDAAGVTKAKALLEHYRAFKALVADLGETMPKEPYRLKSDVSVTRIPIDLKGMPDNYLRLNPTAETIFFVIDWRAPKSMLGFWRDDKKALAINPMALDYLRRYPSQNGHPDDLKIALETMQETIRHELRHMVQFVILGEHPKQSETRPNYAKHGRDYFASPVEFDPTIGSLTTEFIQQWRLYGEESSQSIDLKTALRRFTGLSPSQRFRPFEVMDFFRHLKADDAQRYRLAVKKFYTDVMQKLADHHSK